jgi:hypothetical protein
MIHKILLATMAVLSLLTYKFPITIPLGFFLVVFYLYLVHKALLNNKQIVDENTTELNRTITTLLTNQKVLSSDIKSLKIVVDKNHGDKKIISQEVKKGLRRIE